MTQAPIDDMQDEPTYAAEAEIENVRIIAMIPAKKEYFFAIVLKENGKVIGEIDAYPESGEPHQDENTTLDTFSPCWMLNKEYQGNGYAYEAAHAFFDYLFDIR